MLGLASAIVFIALLRYRSCCGWASSDCCCFCCCTTELQEYVARFGRHPGARPGHADAHRRVQDALRLISRYPVFGVGFSGVPDIDLYLGVSSVYLLMAENMGVVGLLAFPAGHGRLLRHGAAHGAPASSTTGELLLGLSGSVAGVLVSGVMDHYLFNLAYPHMVQPVLDLRRAGRGDDSVGTGGGGGR